MFLLIEQNQVTLRDEPLSLELMQQLVGDPTERAYVEYIRECFSDPAIDLVCDEEGLFKGCTPVGTVCNMGGFALCGTLLAVAVNDEGDTIGLTDKQVQIVLNELSVALETKPYSSKLKFVPAKSLFTKQT